MTSGLQDTLKRFRFKGKGPLCVALVVTQHARKKGLPLEPNELVTEGGGQVLGLGKNAVQKVLKRHGIKRVLAAEGGRTSRGSLNNMREYVALLNTLDKQGLADLDEIEAYWVHRVKEFFTSKPFRIKLDASKGLRAVLRDVINQALERQREAGGTYYAGAVMQHLVGAKLDCALGSGQVKHNSFSTADAPSGRAGDFRLDDVAIHVTTSPGESVIERCRENLSDGYRPILVTMERGHVVAAELARNAGIGDRIDLFEVEQFLALHLYEMGRFSADGRQKAIVELIVRYNEIVEEVETDPSLKIRLNK